MTQPAASELRQLLIKLEHGEAVAGGGEWACECWPYEKLKVLTDYISAAQQQLVKELMEGLPKYAGSGSMNKLGEAWDRGYEACLKSTKAVLQDKLKELGGDNE